MPHLPQTDKPHKSTDLFWLSKYLCLALAHFPTFEFFLTVLTSERKKVFLRSWELKEGKKQTDSFLAEEKKTEKKYGICSDEAEQNYVIFKHYQCLRTQKE